MSIFVDVGAHEGQTLAAVVERGFDVIHAFEPMPAQFAVLARDYGEVAVLHNVGLADRTGPMPVYGTNANLGASIFAAKADVEPDVVTFCDFVEAAGFLAGLPEPAVVKLNCEGAEVVILDNLVDRGVLDCVAHVLIDFDIRKVSGMADHAERVLARLARAGFDRYSLADEVMVGATHQARTHAWLDAIGAP